MKKLLLTMLGVVLTLPALAQDFEYTYEGQTLIYTVLDEDAKTCMTKQGDYTAGNAVAGEVTIPSIAKDGDTEYTVTSIGNKAFYMCGNLTSVEIPNSITSIGDGAFSNCFKLSSIEIPTSVISIGEKAFQNCETFTSIEIPGSVTSIGDAPFMDCRRLKSIEVSAENPNYASIDGVLFNKDISTLIQFPGGNTECAIPNSVTSIADNAFSCCRYLTSVEIPNSVTSIGDKAFYQCTSLALIEIPNAVTSIGESAFSSCSSLTSVEIPNSVATIDGMAFYMCSHLASVKISGSVTSIGAQAFANCQELTSIDVSADNPNFASIDGVLFNKDISTLIQYPGGMTGDYVIPNTVTSIGDDAFSRNISLASIEIPNTVTSIGECAFLSCRGLKSVKIPGSVASIGAQAFYLCNALASVYYDTDEPIECSEFIFSKTTYSSATLYMTETGADKGRTINPWMNFTTIEVYDFPDSIEDIETESNAPCEVYSLSGAKVGNSTYGLVPGIYIMRQGNVVKKIAIR